MENANPEPDYADRAAELLTEFDEDIDWTQSEIEDELEVNVTHGVPIDEAVATLRRRIRKEANLEPPEQRHSATDVSIQDLREAETWLTMTATVAQLWEADNESIGQVGLLADHTGTIKFVAWETSDLPTLTEGETYEIQNAVTDRYQDTMSVNLNETTQISPADSGLGEPIEGETAGFIVDVDARGAVDRCPTADCPWDVTNGRCPQHGDVSEVTPTDELRVTVDNGRRFDHVICSPAFLEGLTDQPADALTLTDAESGDSDLGERSDDEEPAVAYALEQSLIGTFVSVEGPLRRGHIVGKRLREPAAVSLDDHLVRAQERTS